MSMVILSSPSPRPLQLNLPFSSFTASSNFNHKILLFSHNNSFPRKTWRQHSMFLNTKPVVKDGVLSFNGNDALKGIPDNVVVTPWSNSSLFLGATSTQNSSRHVFKLGVLQDTRLLCLFRFKIWWVIPRVGNSASDIPIETQMLLLEAREEPGYEDPNESSTPNYIVFLPVLDGELRSSLQGNSANELEVCVETGNSFSDWLNCFAYRHSTLLIVDKTTRLCGELQHIYIGRNGNCNKFHILLLDCARKL